MAQFSESGENRVALAGAVEEISQTAQAVDGTRNEHVALPRDGSCPGAAPEVLTVVEKMHHVGAVCAVLNAECAIDEPRGSR